MKKNILFFIFFLVLMIFNLYAEKRVSYIVLNSGDTCQYTAKLWLMDNNDDNKFDMMFYGGCPPIAKSFNLFDKSKNILNNDGTAFIFSGNIFSNSFLIYLIEPIKSTYSHKIYFDAVSFKAVLEDYTDNSNEPSTYEEADNYFYTQQMGSILLITKKAGIDVQSVLLCSLDGRIITHLQNIWGWSQFSFDMSLEPSGMYLLRFIARDRALTKRVIYVR